MIYGYVRVSTDEQNVESQKYVISRQAQEKRLLIDEWIEVEMSSRKSYQLRRITELMDKVKAGDVIICTELSRIGRSIKEVLEIIEELVVVKKCRIIIEKSNLDITEANRDDMTNKILITLLSMLAELERDFISERTREGMRALKAKGVRMGKPTGTIQSSIYDKDHDRIKHLYSLGIPVRSILEIHLKYGKDMSLRNYIKKHKLTKGETL